MCRWSEVPAGHDQHDTVPRDVVLDAHVVLRPISVEDPAGGLGVEVIERGDPHAAVGQQVVVDAVREAVPFAVSVDPSFLEFALLGDANTSTLSAMSGQVSSTLEGLTRAIDDLDLPVDSGVVTEAFAVSGSAQCQAAGRGGQARRRRGVA